MFQRWFSDSRNNSVLSMVALWHGTDFCCKQLGEIRFVKTFSSRLFEFLTVRNKLDTFFKKFGN